MCNVRYEFRNNSLLESAFEHEYYNYLGFAYKCKLCQAILKTSFDALQHVMHYHNIKTIEDLEKALRVSESLEKVEESKASNNTKQEEPKPRNDIKKEVVRSKQALLYKWLKP